MRVTKISSTILTSVLGILVLLIVGCQTVKNAEVISTPPSKTADSNLTQIEAQQRSQGISKISYEIFIELNDKSLNFKGRSRIRFELKEAKATFLDFKYGRVSAMSINGQTLAPTQDGFRIQLPKSNLVSGPNEVLVDYTQEYSKNGAGMYRFQDPADKEVYVYTQFEPFDANHLFPCFDQPDLKATFALEVLAPKHWVVVSTTLETSVKNSDQEKKHWKFETTPLLSTYVVSLHAGPYTQWKSQFRDIPLRLLARKSMARQVRVNEWMEPLKYSLSFFNKLFDYPYPFKKYDQIIVPDFNAGAMENVGAVTFSERYLRDGSKTRKEKERLVEVILHEAAHMWFGNLVTMKWWNGLWLNESFATYISMVAMSRNPEYLDVWENFALGDKNWAYTEDQFVTTHPIELPVADTLNAFTNFDGITYGKGASVLKQLHFLVGDEAFTRGLRAYFKKHQWGNTEISDFLSAIGEASQQNLKVWGERWLEESGLDSIKIQASCKDGKYDRVEILQRTAPGSGIFRPHRSQVGLFDRVGKDLKLRKTFDVQYQAAVTEIPSLKGVKCADFVYPNVNDHDYVNVELDAQSLASLGSGRGVSAIRDSLVRLLVWVNLYQMVKDKKLLLTGYGDLAIEALKTESQVRIVDKILESLLGWGRSGYMSLRYYWPSDVRVSKRNEFISRLEDVLLHRANSAAVGSDDQKQFLDAFVKASESEKALRILESLLDSPSRFKLDQDRRWELVAKLSQLGAKSSDSRIKREVMREKSEKVIQMSFSAMALKPDLKQKKYWLSLVTDQNTKSGMDVGSPESSDNKIEGQADIKTDRGLSLARAKSIMSALNRYLVATDEEKAFKAELQRDFYALLPELIKSKDQEFLGEFVEYLTPRGCTYDGADNIRTFLKFGAKTLPPVVSKPMRIILQDEELCLDLRKLL